MTEDEKEIRARKFAARFDGFMRRWAPADPRLRDEFNRDLMLLWHGLYCDMGEAYAQVVSHQFPSVTMILTEVPDAGSKS